MPGQGVIPAIRVKDVGRSLAFYVDELGFMLERGGASDVNCAISRGDARLMLERAADLYSDEYNAAIQERLPSKSAIALYIEAPDLESLYDGVQAAGILVMDPLGDRPWGQAEFTVEDPDGTWITFWRAGTDRMG
jgi:uncharacterized glyoxalase superfamily protein PhnB